MRKVKLVLSVLIAVALFFYISGCTPASRTAKFPPEQQAAVSAPAAEQGHSSYYHYLESRFHLKDSEPEKAAVSLEKALETDPDSFILNRDLIRINLVLKNREKAIALAEQLIKTKPDHVDSLLMFIQLKKDDIEEKQLVEILERILKLDPSNKETFLRLGRIYMDQNDKIRALELFQQMVEKFPEYYVAWYYLGEIQFIDKKYRAAETAFLKSIELEPELLEPRFQLVNVYNALKIRDRYTRIKSLYNQILELDPDNHRALLGMALTLYKSGSKKKAEKRFATLAQDIDKDTTLLMAAFDEYLSGENDKDALIVFSQMLKAAPDNSTLIFFTAMVYENLKMLDKAIALYGKVAPNHPQYKKAGLSMALIYREKGQNNVAINFLETRLKESPKDIDTLTYLASFYEKEHQYEKAIALLERGVGYSPKNTGLLFRLGAVQDKAGNHPKALEMMKAVLDIDPDDASALNYLGYSWAEKGTNLEQALAMISKADTLRPDDGYITDSLGWVYFKMGDFDNAVFYLEKAARITGYETIIADHLGDAYEKKGNLKKAIDSYRRAIKSAVDDDDKKKIPAIEKKIKDLQSRLNE